MKLEFVSYELVGLNCPYFTGVKDHGQKLTLNYMDVDMCDYFKTFGEGNNSIHIHQDGTIYSTEMNYSYREEEWVETITMDLTNNTTVKNELDKWLKQNPLYRSKQFPYRISNEKDFWGCEMICDSLDSLLKYLKTY